MASRSSTRFIGGYGVTFQEWVSTSYFAELPGPKGITVLLIFFSRLKSTYSASKPLTQKP